MVSTRRTAAAEADAGQSAPSVTTQPSSPSEVPVKVSVKAARGKPKARRKPSSKHAQADTSAPESSASTAPAKNQNNNNNHQNNTVTTTVTATAPAVAGAKRHLRNTNNASPLQELGNLPARKKRAGDKKPVTASLEPKQEQKGFYFSDIKQEGAQEEAPPSPIRTPGSDKLRQQNSSLSTEVAGLTFEIQLLKSKHARANEDLQTSQAELSQVKKDYADLKAEQAKKDERIAFLETDLARMKKVANELSSEYTQYRNNNPLDPAVALLNKIEANARIQNTEPSDAEYDEVSIDQEDDRPMTPHSASLAEEQHASLNTPIPIPRSSEAKPSEANTSMVSNNSFVSAAGSPLVPPAMQSPDPAVETPTPSTATMSPRPAAETPAATPTASNRSQTGKRVWNFGRSMSSTISAFKSSLLYFSTPRAPPSTIASSKRKPSPEPGSLAEVLMPSPTPVGERTMTERARTSHFNSRKSLQTLLSRGMKEDEEARAEAWINQVLDKLTNDPDAGEKRKRLEVPVLLDDLKILPSHKPWEGGFGDPLADYDDDEVVPVWAVYEDMMAQEEHQRKKRKSTHEVTMEDDVPSLNETFHGKGNSPLGDLHPRPSVVPSPIFGGNSRDHEKGRNVFKELHHSAVVSEKIERIPHNPAKGSFSCPESDSDSDEMPEGEQDGVSLWTQPPPAAPVPAHASLPVSTDVVATDVVLRDVDADAIDEVERQRAKLMKHTPAKPSRLRTINFPSPSIVSESGTPLQLQIEPAAPGMPEPELLDFYDPEVEANARSFTDTEKMQVDAGSFCDGDIVISYSDSDSMTDE